VKSGRSTDLRVSTSLRATSVKNTAGKQSNRRSPAVLLKKNAGRLSMATISSNSCGFALKNVGATVHEAVSPHR
jgi:hypothetical protein